MSPVDTSLYRPLPTSIRSIRVENEARDIRTFDLVFKNTEDEEGFRFVCGQFGIVSVRGHGESPIGIASSPLERGFLRFTVKRYPSGVVTTALHDLEEGDEVGVRGPYGRPFPMETMEGKNIVIVAGGFAFTTLRSTITYLIHENNRHRYGSIDVVYGARSPGELIYKPELSEWEDRDDINMAITVDRGDEDWGGHVGLIPVVLKEVAPSAENAIVLVCGPPIMLRFTVLALDELGFTPEVIYTSLERRMTCGLGKCGKCNVGSLYVCKDGPVISLQELQKLGEPVF